MEDVMRLVKSLEESGLLIKRISEKIKNEAKEQKGGFLPILFRDISCYYIRNALSGEGLIRAGQNI